MVIKVKKPLEEIKKLISERWNISSERSLEYGIQWKLENGLVLNYYNSGKIVVQGKTDQGILKVLEELLMERELYDENIVGVDESGKGEVFGPLVMCAVRIKEMEFHCARSLKDSKQLKGNIFDIYNSIKDCIEIVSIKVIEPIQYNRLYEEFKNQHKIMEHILFEILGEIKGYSGKKFKVIVDKFGEIDVGEGWGDIEVVLEEKADENIPVVSFASIVARYNYLLWLKKAEENLGINLPSGAGEDVVKVAKKIYKKFGIDILRSLAKLHFKPIKAILESES